MGYCSVAGIYQMGTRKKIYEIKYFEFRVKGNDNR